MMKNWNKFYSASKKFWTLVSHFALALQKNSVLDFSVAIVLQCSAVLQFQRNDVSQTVNCRSTDWPESSAWPWLPWVYFRKRKLSDFQTDNSSLLRIYLFPWFGYLGQKTEHSQFVIITYTFTVVTLWSSEPGHVRMMGSRNYPTGGYIPISIWIYKPLSLDKKQQQAIRGNNL